MENKFYTGAVAGVFGTAGIVLDIYENKLIENQSVGLVPLPPARGVGQGYPVSSAKETRGWAISATSENPDLVFELLEFLATDEGQHIDRYGLEGTHYNVVNGEVVFTDEKANWWPRFHEVMSWDALENLYKEYSFKIISGEYEIDKFDDFVAEWYRLGGDDITEYANSVLN